VEVRHDEGVANHIDPEPCVIIERKIDTEALGQFVTALTDIFDPQDNLCLFGQEPPYNARAFEKGCLNGLCRSRAKGINLKTYKYPMLEA